MTTKRKRSVEPAFTVVEAKDYEELLTCCVCTELVFKRVFLKCGHSFCKKCLDQSKTCPKCRGCKEGARELLSEFEKVIYDKILVECNQCEQQMNCQLAEKHKESCWRYRCTNPGCSDLVSDQKRHDTMCSYIQKKCRWAPKCKWKGLVKDFGAHENRHIEFVTKMDKLEQDLENLKEEYAVTVFHGRRKEQFVPMEYIPENWDKIESFEYTSDSVKFSVWNEDLLKFEELVIPKSDPRLVCCIHHEDEYANRAEDMGLALYWAPDRVEEDDDPGSQLFSS